MRVTPKTLTSLVKCCAKEQGRYKMDGILVRPTEGTLTATDGRRLAILKVAQPDPEGGEPFFLPRDLATRAAKAAPKNGHVTIERDRIGPLSEAPPDDTFDFPKYESVVPDVRKGSLCIGLNASLLSELASALGPSETVALVIRDPALHSGSWTCEKGRLPYYGGPILVRKAHDPDCESYGVIMPVRVNLPDPSHVSVEDGEGQK